MPYASASSAAAFHLPRRSRAVDCSGPLGELAAMMASDVHTVHHGFELDRRPPSAGPLAEIEVRLRG